MRRVLMCLTAAAVLVGCGQDSTDVQAGDGNGDSDGVVVLAKAEGWRDGLVEGDGHHYALLEIAGDEEAAHRAWDQNVPASLPEAEGDAAEPGLYGELDWIDFRQQVLVVFSSGESGTCPAWVADIHSDEDRVEVELASASDEVPGCTDDFNPYRLVLAVDRDRLPEADQLPVERIDVPSENLTDVDGRAIEYPEGP